MKKVVREIKREVPKQISESFIEELIAAYTWVPVEYVSQIKKIGGSYAIFITPLLTEQLKKDYGILEAVMLPIDSMTFLVRLEYAFAENPLYDQLSSEIYKATEKFKREEMAIVELIERFPIEEDKAHIELAIYENGERKLLIEGKVDKHFVESLDDNLANLYKKFKRRVRDIVKQILSNHGISKYKLTSVYIEKDVDRLEKGELEEEMIKVYVIKNKEEELVTSFFIPTVLVVIGIEEGEANLNRVPILKEDLDKLVNLIKEKLGK